MYIGSREEQVAWVVEVVAVVLELVGVLAVVALLVVEVVQEDRWDLFVIANSF